MLITADTTYLRTERRSDFFGVAVGGDGFGRGLFTMGLWGARVEPSLRGIGSRPAGRPPSGRTTAKRTAFRRPGPHAAVSLPQRSVSETSAFISGRPFRNAPRLFDRSAAPPRILVTANAQRKSTSRRVQAVQNSLTLEITSKAADMRAKGHDVVAFAAGEPDFDAPEYVKDAAIAAIKAGKGKYTAAMGMPDLRKAVSEKFRKQDGFDFAPNHLHERRQTLALQRALRRLQSRRRSPLPGALRTPIRHGAVEAVPVSVESKLETGYEADPAALRKAITPKTRMLTPIALDSMVAVYSRATLEAVAQLARETGIVVLCDDIYEHLTYDGAKYLSRPI